MLKCTKNVQVPGCHVSLPQYKGWAVGTSVIGFLSGTYASLMMVFYFSVGWNVKDSKNCSFLVADSVGLFLGLRTVARGATVRVFFLWLQRQILVFLCLESPQFLNFYCLILC